MPYRRSKSFRRRPAAASTKSIRKIAQSVVRSNAEVKARTSEHDESTLNTLTQNLRDFTPSRIRGGTMENERVGNEVSMHGIDVRGYLHNNSTTDSTHVRAMAIIDRKANGLATNLDGLLLKNNTPSSWQQGAMGSVLAVNRARYKVLWDQVFTLAPRVAGSGSSYVRTFKKFIKTNLKLKFGDHTDDSITQNDVKVVFFACESDGDINFGETVELYAQVIGYYRDI